LDWAPVIETMAGAKSNKENKRAGRRFLAALGMIL
jgi:hypothetical protein